MAWFWLRTAAKRRRARASIFWCIRAIRVESHEGVTGTMVRKLPLARIERQKGRQAVGAGSMAAGQGGTKAKLTGAQQARLVQQMDAWMESVNDIGALQRLNQILADRHGPARHRNLPDEFFVAVADAYRFQVGNVTDALPTPALIIARATETPLSTVKGWIHRTRRRGYLLPARRGRAG
jgi:hypothetical protein